MAEKTKPTATDAELILKLYDLRRETRMREARNYFLLKFFPSSYDDLMKLMMDRESNENAYIRQVNTYWEMAATFVVQGILNEQLFFETCQEMYTVYAKIKPFLAQIRKDYSSPTFLKNMETVAEGSPEGRERVATIERRLEQMAKMAAK